MQVILSLEVKESARFIITKEKLGRLTGGYLGKRLLDFFNIETSSSWVGTILTAVIGAILLIYLWRIITKKKK